MGKLSLFSVPLFRAELADSIALNAELRQLFLQREAEGQRWRNPDPLMSIQQG